MKMHVEIACPICRKANPDFEGTSRQINQAQAPADKAYFARRLIEQVEAVKKEHAGSDTMLTEACRTLLNLRKQTAELILKFQGAS